MTIYHYDAHLALEDEQLFSHRPRTWLAKIRLAALDVLRDIQRHGYLEDPDHQLIDDFEKATTTVAFVASGDGVLTVPAGTEVVALDPDASIVLEALCAAERLVFVTDAELVVPAGQTASVSVTARNPGTPYNVEAGWISACVPELDNLASLSNDTPATGGADHQLTRANVYRTLELAMLDLMREADDAFGTKRRIYAKLYAAEIQRVMAAGVRVDTDADGEQSEGEKQATRASFQGFGRG